MTTGDVKRKLTAIFSADVEGYSRLMEEDELATIETLTSHKEIMRKLIRQYRGRVVDSTGDNLLAEFASVVDAVQCAVEVQQILSSKNETLPENRRMYFRIGINLGDVVEEGELIYGDGVNVAARVESLAEGGGISISGTAYDQLGKKLPLGYEYLGEQTVKNIEKPVRVYRVLTEAEAAGKVIGEIRPRTKQLRWAAIGGVVILILVAGALAIWNFYLRPTFEPASEKRMAFQLPDQPSIAVLPFDNLSVSTERDALGDAVSESIIYTLSYLPGMFVISRNTAFTYKGKPVEIRQVAEELGVRYVLEGSVMRAEDRVRVTAQLIDAMSGYHIWSGRFDKTMDDFFSLLDDITKTIAIELKVRVSEPVFDLSRKTNNFDAWASTTRAYSLIVRGRENAVEARELAKKAVTLDPEYAFGWAVLAVVHTLEVLYGVSESPAESIKLAFEANEKALNLEPTLSCATANRGQIYMLQGRIEEAIALGEKAIAMAPGLETNHLIMGIIMDFAGRFEEAIAFYKKAMRLNPFYTAGYMGRYGMACLMADRHEEALTAFKELLARAQRGEYTRLFPHLGLSAVNVELGKNEEARIHTSEILKIDPSFSLVAAKKTYRWKDPSNTERWLSSLRKAGLPETPPLPLPDKPSIAVLPFVNMSGDPEQEYFSDGISEEIITALSKTPKMFVIARTSSFKYKGKEVDVRSMGRELGVRYVLEGSVRKFEDRWRITAQLVDAKTGNPVWAERYDRDLKDIFAIYDEITMKVITALEVELTEGETARLWGKGTHNLKAYLKFLQGREHWRRFTKEGNFSARRLLNESIALDPEYPSPYSWLGATHMMELYFQTTKSRKHSLEQAVQLVQKAIALDDSQADAHALLGFLYTNYFRQYEKGIAEGRLAIALNPNGASEHGYLSITLRLLGRYEEAVQMAQKAIRLNPFPSGSFYRTLGWAYICTGSYEEAISAFKTALTLTPGDINTHLPLTIAYSLSGREEEARAEVANVLRLNREFSLEKWAKTVQHKNKADSERFFDALRKAGLN